MLAITFFILRTAASYESRAWEYAKWVEPDQYGIFKFPRLATCDN